MVKVHQFGKSLWCVCSHTGNSLLMKNRQTSTPRNKTAIELIPATAPTCSKICPNTYGIEMPPTDNAMKNKVYALEDSVLGYIVAADSKSG